MSNKLTTNSQWVLVISLMVLFGGLANPAAAQRRPTQVSQNRLTQQQSGNEDANVVFRSARDLITDGEWAKAQEKFNQYVSSFPNEKNIEAAMYWLAYTQQKLARYDQCRTTLSRLLEKYPNSTWKEDARVLLAQLPGTYLPGAVRYEELITTAGVNQPFVARPPEGGVIYAPIAPAAAIGSTPLPGQIAATTSVYAAEGFNNDSADDDPCEFKIVVLQALFQTDVQRGIMAATDWLKPGSNQTTRCKSAALTLLGRHGGKAVTPVILGVARSEPDLKLRARAISTLGATNDDTVIDSLREFALNSPENDIVEASLYALSRHTGDRAITCILYTTPIPRDTDRYRIRDSAL
jgi:tetratricopeptide (TPR) repeat protein